MSYHIEVFSTQEPPAPAAQEGRGWQIVVDGPLRVEPEDIPSGVRPMLPGIRFLTRFHLEGDAPATAVKKLAELAKSVARAARGVVVDQQQGTVQTPRGVRRLDIEPERPGERLLQMSWFVADAAPLARSVPAELLDLFQRTIPEVLPRRYGLCEPPQFALATHGIDHLRQFLVTHLRDSVVWYCQKPCRHVFLSIPDRAGATPRGFRCGRLTLNVDGAAAGDRGWRVELTRLWSAVADLFQPFYAEIRMGECPTKSWWWNGIPTPVPSASLIGEPYTRLWPEFVSAAGTSRAGLPCIERFIDDAGKSIPAPPPNIARPLEPARQTVVDPSKPEDMTALFQVHSIPYPEVWPFEGPIS